MKQERKNLVEKERNKRKGKGHNQDYVCSYLPDTVQVAEIYPLPEATAKTVANPTGDGEHPQNHRQLGKAQGFLVSAAVRDLKM